MPVLNYSLPGDPLVCFGWGRAMRWLSACHHLSALGETSKLIGCSLHIQQPATANLYRKCYTLLLNAAAFWLQPAVMNFDVFPYGGVFGWWGSTCVCLRLAPSPASFAFAPPVSTSCVLSTFSWYWGGGGGGGTDTGLVLVP